MENEILIRNGARWREGKNRLYALAQGFGIARGDRKLGMHCRNICNSHFGYFHILLHFPAQCLIDIAQIHAGGAGQRVSHFLPQISHVQPSGVTPSVHPMSLAPLALGTQCLFEVPPSVPVSQVESRREGLSTSYTTMTIMASVC